MNNKKLKTAKDIIEFVEKTVGCCLIKINTNAHEYQVYIGQTIMINDKIVQQKTIIPNKIFKQITKRKLITVAEKRIAVDGGSSRYNKTYYKVTNKGKKLITAITINNGGYLNLTLNEINRKYYYTGTTSNIYFELPNNYRTIVTDRTIVTEGEI